MLPLLLVLFALIGAFAIITPPGTFVSSFNVQSILTDSSLLLILAAGTTLVLVSGGLDLSIGSTLTFSSVVALKSMQGVGVEEGWLAVGVGTAVGIGAGMAWGVLNGVLVAYARLPPFVVTLGTLGAALGVARIITGGISPGGAPPQLQQSIGLGDIAGVPALFVIGAITASVLGVVLVATRFGEHLYLIGSNLEGAKRAGIHVQRRQVQVYVLSGAMAGLAGLVDLARFDTASVVTGHTVDLLGSLAAVIIGGTSLFGGIGTVAGSIIGVYIPTILNNGLVIMDVPRFWQDVTVGTILVAAVWFDQWKRARQLNTAQASTMVSSEDAVAVPKASGTGSSP